MIKGRKICVVTGSRAEYGLLYWLLKDIEKADDLELQIIATGMHLSPEFGLTYKKIETDGFQISQKIEMLLSSDTSIGISKAMGLGMIGFADAFESLKPDIVLMLGDRFELLSAASAALVAAIPVAHIHGGEVTTGAFDEAIRHSITKMSHLHFPATEDYRRRVIQLGEHPDRVFNVGAPGLDNVRRLRLMEKAELADVIGISLDTRSLLVTWHPVTLEPGTTQKDFVALLGALDELCDTQFIFTKANADTDGRIVNQMIDEYVSGCPDRAVSHTSLGRLRYLSALKYVDGIVGNSSSGIIEAPSLATGTVNIGDRQRGRTRAVSIIDVPPDKDQISGAIKRLFSEDFKVLLSGIHNPYDGGEDVSGRIVERLRLFPLEGIVKKSFYNYPVQD